MKRKQRQVKNNKGKNRRIRRRQREVWGNFRVQTGADPIGAFDAVCRQFRILLK